MPTNSLILQHRSHTFSITLQIMLQGDTIHPEKLCYLFRRLITLAESKSIAFEWLEQFVQLAGSLDVTIPEDDMEWLVAKAWNIVSNMCILLWHTKMSSD
uniref:Ku C-terminal domain-containing protein n=1 Tax=Globisporangium ultimum (strain ATCC 200006 / CBS 805.95 / DAOM BR144) TaxID=431595 RepID=K3WQ92_GLOUD